MTFNQGKLFMEKLNKKVSNQSLHSNTYRPSPQLIPALVLFYPGRINSKAGDYRLEYNNQQLTHTDIVKVVHQCALEGQGVLITNFLVDLFNNGINANTNFKVYVNINNTRLNLMQFKHLIYWLILQEDINYPRPKFFGIRMPLIRYIEGAVAALHPNLLSLDVVLKRTNNHNKPPEKAFHHDEIEEYLVRNLQAIK